MKANKKVVIITGCSSGIGKSTVSKYIKEGFYVIGFDKCPCQEMDNFSYYQVNLTEEEEIKKVYQTIKSEGILINYLINCAGVFYCNERYEIADMNSQEWNSVLNNNLSSCMYVVKYAIPLFDTREDSAIVFVSSDQANMPRKKNGAYATSKGAINTFARACAVELVDKRIRANVVDAASVLVAGKSIEGVKEYSDVYVPKEDIIPFKFWEWKDMREILIKIYSICSTKDKKNDIEELNK